MIDALSFQCIEVVHRLIRSLYIVIYNASTCPIALLSYMIYTTFSLTNSCVLPHGQLTSATGLQKEESDFRLKKLVSASHMLSLQNGVVMQLQFPAYLVPFISKRFGLVRLFLYSIYLAIVLTNRLLRYTTIEEGSATVSSMRLFGLLNRLGRVLCRFGLFGLYLQLFGRNQELMTLSYLIFTNLTVYIEWLAIYRVRTGAWIPR